MIVEIAGIPGSGKTTFCKSLKAELLSRGIPVSDTAETPASQSAAVRLPRFVQAKPHRELLFRFARFHAQHPRFVGLTENLYDGDDVKRFLLFLLGANYQTCLDAADHDEVVLLDEGFLTHIVAACWDHRDTGLFDSLIAAMPVADAVVHLDIPAELAFERAVGRRKGVANAFQKVTRKFGGPTAFASRAALLRRGSSLCRMRGSAVIEAGAELSAGQAAASAADRLAAVLARDVQSA